MIRIWLTRAGASKVHVIDMLRNNPDGEAVTVYASRPTQDGPALTRADHVFTEPDWDASDLEYAQFALEQVRKHGIEFLLPSCRMRALAPYRDEFARLGCHLMVAADENVARITDSKTETYKVAAALGVPVPPHHKVNSAVQFYDAVKSIQESGHRACIKPDTGWSAGGFRIIDDSDQPLASLLDTMEPVMRTNDYIRTLVRAQRLGNDIPDLIVMPYLEAPETSVDVLSGATGRVLTSVARVKTGIYRDFVNDARVLDIAHTLVEGLPLSGLSNIQTRNLDGTPVLLEVNARPSAGVPHTLHTGINMCWEAIRALRVPSAAIPAPRTGLRVAVTEATVEIV